MDLIPSETGSDGLEPGQFKMTDNALALANIKTTIVGSALDLEENRLSLSGKIAVNKEAIAVQASYFDGRIERLNVTYEGQQISKGQLLATIYSPELVAAQQELLTAASIKESQPQLYNAVRNKLKLWKLTDDQINNIERSGKIKENFPVYATVSGTVTEVMSAEGNYVKVGQPLARVSNLNTVWANFDVYENQLSQFQKGQKISISTNAYPNESFEGRVSFIDAVLNTDTRTVTVRAVLNNRKNLFKPGMFVTGKIDAGKSAQVAQQIYVPSSAVLWTGERSLVYVKAMADAPVFEMREVELGNRNGDQIEIIAGLAPGEEIVSNGTFTVDAAAQLQGTKSMMNKTGGKTMTGHEGHLGTSPESSSAGTSDQEMRMSFPATFNEELLKAIPMYLKLKDAFVSGNVKEASSQAEVTSKALAAANTQNLGGMEKSHLEKSIEMLNAIASSDKLEDQRSLFVVLNQNIVPLAMNMENSNTPLFIQKCPMADRNRGAYWMSTDREIRNPYYGDAMMKCGSIVDSIQ
jgi:Cu(I)/Ag(I) efflux system membrane fusion protein